MAAAGGAGSAAAGGPGFPAGRKFVLFTWPKNDRNYIFHPNGKYWCLKGTSIDADFPREGRDHKLWGIDFPIDAMLNWGGYSYVFSGKRYWRLNASGDGFDRGYPQPISAWGVEGPIDAALNWNGRTYFFVGKQYYRINKGGNGVDAGYPMSNKDGWGIDEVITGAYNDGSRVMFLMTGKHAELCTPMNVSTGMPDGKITYKHTDEWFDLTKVAPREKSFFGAAVDGAAVAGQYMAAGGALLVAAPVVALVCATPVVAPVMAGGAAAAVAGAVVVGAGCMAGGVVVGGAGLALMGVGAAKNAVVGE